MLISRYPPDLAGMEMACQRLSQTLVARGYSVTVLTEKTDRNFPTDRLENGVRVVRFSSWGRPPISTLIYCLKALGFLVRNPDFDILHAHMLAGPALLALVMGRLQRKPVLVKMACANERGDIGASVHSVRGKIKLGLFRRWAQDIVAPSPEVEEEVRDLRADQFRVHSIPNGVDTEFFVPAQEPEKRRARQRFGLPSERLLAIYVGRWTPGKGIEQILEAWTTGAASSNFSWDLFMMIAGEFAPSSEARGQLIQLGDRVRIKTNVMDLRPYYHAADLAILLSDGEGLSNFLLEAMACGVPTLTSESAAVAGVHSGIVLPKTGSMSQHCLQELQRLQEHPGELRTRGQNARDDVVKEFSLAAVADSYERLYATILSRSPLTI